MNRDFVSYAAILVLSLFFMAMTWTIRRAEGSLLTSSLFPRVVFGGLILFAAYGLYKALPVKGVPLKRIGRQAYVMFGMMLLFCILFTKAGFPVAAGLFLLAAGIYTSDDRSIKNICTMALFAVTVTLAIYFVFTKILLFILP